MADREALHQLAGVVSELEEDGRQGEVEPDAPGQEPGGRGVAVGGLEPAAQPQLPGGVSASATRAWVPPRQSRRPHTSWPGSFTTGCVTAWRTSSRRKRRTPSKCASG